MTVSNLPPGGEVYASYLRGDITLDEVGPHITALRRDAVARYDALRPVPTFEAPPAPDPAFHRGLCVGVAVSLVFWVGFAAAWWLS